MSAPLTLRRACASDRPALQRMLELYQYELSDIWDQDLDERGEYGYGLERYWAQPERNHPFVALVDGRYAGFALADTALKVGTAGHWMDQFCVLKKYRRRGVGEALARAVFEALPGAWEVGQMLDNRPAQAFWRRVIGDCSGQRFVEHRLDGPGWQGLVQTFVAQLR